MLSLANDEFSNHGCNDLDKKLYKFITPSMLEDMCQLNSKGKYPWPEKPDQVGDSSLMWYLSHKLKEMATIVERDIKIDTIIDGDKS